MLDQFLIRVLVFLFLINNFSLIADEILPEFQVKRKDIFEFSKEPIISKIDKNVNIEFTVKEFCDVTIAIENKNGDIVRHLASGVLGDNAPTPFKKGSLEQKLIWDYKDDRGKYVDDLENTQVRISLGLKPYFEKNIYSSAYNRISGMPVLATGPEGVYIFEGFGKDSLKLYSHQGEYIKTIYPFPASQIEKIKGIDWDAFANRDKKPAKYSVYRQTLLSSGNNGPTASGNSVGYTGITGKAATTICVQGSRIALANERINRIQTDGSTGGFNLLGPKIGISLINRGNKMQIGPSASTFSPDGKILYYTGYLWHQGYQSDNHSGNVPVVLKVNYESDDEPIVFAGKNNHLEYGDKPDQLSVPSSVETDTNGNVYVSDFLNDRVQIFNPKGELLKSLNTSKPARVLIHKKTNEIYVFSYNLVGVPPSILFKTKFDFDKIPKTICTFSAYPELKNLSCEEFPIGPIGATGLQAQGNSVQIALDSWGKTPVFWIVTRKYVPGAAEKAFFSKYVETEADWINGAIRRIEKIDSKWVESDNFGKRLKKDLVRPKAPTWNNQNLYVNPKNKKLYVGEPDSGPTCKAFNDLLEIDTDTGVAKIIKLPYNPMDIAFDLDGLIYLRTMSVLGRFNMDSWKEVPFDYGAELAHVGDDGGMGGRYSQLVSGLMLPATNAVCYHQGGMDVNVYGNILVACHNRPTMGKSIDGQGHAPLKAYNEYRPDNYPGRLISATSVCLHVWDKHGQVKFQNMVQGCPQTDGVYLDENNNIYMMATPARLANGKEIDDGMSSTIIKFKPQKGKFFSLKSELALQGDQIPKRPNEILGFWVDDYEWMYGGVGFAGFGPKSVGGGCACWFTRFKLDYFARSFAPEPMQYSVSVLDSNGNLITRIGRYGNIDSAGPKSKEPLGGDEVGLFHPCFVATLTDKKLFISDIGNERIVSVLLGYHKDVILPLTKK